MVHNIRLLITTDGLLGVRWVYYVITGRSTDVRNTSNDLPFHQIAIGLRAKWFSGSTCVMNCVQRYDHGCTEIL